MLEPKTQTTGKGLFEGLAMRWNDITHLTEAPIVRHGNWDYDPANIAEFSKAVADTQWRKMDTITFDGNPVVYDILRHRVENAWKVARLVTKTQQRTNEPYQVYDVVFFINFRRETGIDIGLNTRASIDRTLPEPPPV